MTDILLVDELIGKELDSEYGKIKIYEEKIEVFRNLLKKEYTIPEKTRENLSNQIFELRKKIDNVESTKLFYTAETGCLINRYRYLLKIPRRIVFLNSDCSNDDIYLEEKNEIIDKYIKIAKGYTSTDYFSGIQKREKKFKVTCTNCYNIKSFDIIDNCVWICLGCGNEQEIRLLKSSYTDASRISITKKHFYTRKINFEDAITRFQALEDLVIPDQVYRQITHQLELHGLLVGTEHTDRSIRFSKLEKSHIRMFLKILDYSKYYENMNLIYYNLTGKQPPNLSQIRDKLLDDFDVLVKVYDEVINEEKFISRKSFLSVQYVLYQFLQRYKFPCNKNDFTMLKTSEKRQFHDYISKKCFDKLNWKHF